MPVIIHEVEAIPQVVPATTQQPVESAAPVSPPEYELMQVLHVMKEREARLQFD